MTPGTSEYRTKIDWAECADAQRYLVVLWDSAGKELVRQESPDCYYYDYLTEGDYTVQVSACNGENDADSEKVAFRVEEHSQPGRFDIQVLSGSGTTRPGCTGRSQTAQRVTASASGTA